MPNLKKQNPSESIPEDKESLANNLETTTEALHSQQISELRDLTKSLLSTVQLLQSQNAKNLAFQDAVLDIKAATNAVLMAPSISEGHKPVPKLEKHNSCSCDSSSSCISTNCCEYDIIMTDVRVLNMQIEPIDSNIDTIEVRMFASIDGIGAVIPNMFSVITLHKLVNQLGVWTQINQRIGVVSVSKNTSKSFNIRVDAVEVEEGIAEQATALRDEYGTGSGMMTLDCCCSTAPILIFDIDFTGGGQGGGAISAKFTAVKK